jgi:heptosyltransferase II
MTSPDKILVVGPSWVGDMVMAQSLFMTLQQRHPGCRIDVLAPAWSLPLLERMPEVSEGIAMPLGHGQFNLKARIALGKSLKAAAYDQAILLPNSWKSALVPYFASIPRRTGYLGECRWGLLNDIRRLDKSVLTMTVQRFVALGLPKDADLPPEFPVPQLKTDLLARGRVIAKFGLTDSGSILALCPGAEYGPAKRWPAEHFAEVANAKLADGWHVWLMGSEKDQPVTDEINRLCHAQCRDFAGQTSLVEAIDLIDSATAVVSNDSGLMHLAAALNKPVIALYGSSDPKFTPPLNQAAQIISLGLDCSPCFKRECPLYPPNHPSHMRCLSEISPAQVLGLLAR